MADGGGMTNTQWGLLYVVAICLLLGSLMDLSGLSSIGGLANVCLMVAGICGLAFLLLDLLRHYGRPTNQDDLNEIAQQIEDEHDGGER